jgi:putative DNA primase/helicase
LEKFMKFLPTSTWSITPPESDETNDSFISHVFGTFSGTARALVTSFNGDPSTRPPELGWSAIVYPEGSSKLQSRNNNYISYSLYNPVSGKYKRRKENFVALYGIVLDDIGTKVGWEKIILEPSYIVETSKGNYQCVYLLSTPISDKNLIARIWDALKDSGQTDKGSGGMHCRLGRLPIGINGKKDFKTVWVHYRPDLRYSLNTIIESQGWIIKPQSEPRITPADKLPSHEFIDQVLDTLKEKDLYKSQISTGKHNITCPWMSTHTGKVDSGTVYYEPDPEFPLGGFKCLHDSCAERHLSDFYRELDIKRPGEIPNLIRVSDRGGRSLVAESEAATALINMLRGRLAYDVISSLWYKFNGTHWQGGVDNVTVGPMLTDELDKGTLGIGYGSRYYSGVKTQMMAKNSMKLPITDRNALPFRNGMLNLKTGVLMDTTPDNAHTWVLPYEHNIYEDCPNIKVWLHWALKGEEDIVKYARAWLAAILHGFNDMQQFLHLIGPGGTGKSTFQRLIYAMLGEDNVSHTTLRDLEFNNFELAKIQGKRLVVLADSSRYGQSMDNLKRIVGGDPVRCERKNVQQTTDFVYQGTVLMASNEFLASTDHTSGLDRRRAMIVFDAKLTDEEKDSWVERGGESKLLHMEIPGLINWLLELSFKQIIDTIKAPPQTSRDIVVEAMSSSNPVVEWIEDRLTTEPTELDAMNGRSPFATWGIVKAININGERFIKDVYVHMYPSYCDWCEGNGRSPISKDRLKSTVVDTLRTLGIVAEKVRRREGWGISGVRLKTEQELFGNNETEEY